jgi:hypothetical protein
MGIWFGDDRMDFFEIQDEQVKKNADCVVAICMKDSLINTYKGFSILKVKNFGKTFNLCDNEPFSDQPIVAGRLASGFLVGEGIIATAGHMASEENVKDLRFVFGYKMLDPYKPVIRIPNDYIYKGVKIIRRVRSHKRDGGDWALVKLDRIAVGQPVANLSRKKIFNDQPVYTIGHPCGLPLKYAPGARVRNVNKTYFEAELDVFCGNSGSPVFSSDTHEVIGMVVRGDIMDFRWTGRCWISVIYPNSQISSEVPECTKASEFIAPIYTYRESSEGYFEDEDYFENELRNAVSGELYLKGEKLAWEEDFRGVGRWFQGRRDGSLGRSRKSGHARKNCDIFTSSEYCYTVKILKILIMHYLPDPPY